MAFIAFTEAIDLLPASNVFAILFFLMLVVLALDSIFGGWESNIISIEDFKWLPNTSRLQKLCEFCIEYLHYTIELLQTFTLNLHSELLAELM